jgi:hypothetical protein
VVIGMEWFIYLCSDDGGAMMIIFIVCRNVRSSMNL